MPREVAPGVHYWTRGELGLDAPEQVTYAGDKTEFVVHYSTGATLGTADTPGWWRGIQRFHMGPQRNWSDIGYGHGVDRFGNIFEGRGFRTVQAHSPNHNVQGTSVCFLGADDPARIDAPEITKRAIDWLYRQARTTFGHDLRRLAHSETQSPGYTECCGDELRAWVKAWREGRWSATPLPKPDPTPKPNPGTTAPPFPLPRGHWFGPKSPDGRNHSGYWAQDRPKIEMLQKRLRQRGWRGVNVTGRYDAATEAAIRGFQQDKHLPVDGRTGAVTWPRLWTAPIT
jgi:hypothetical protein